MATAAPSLLAQSQNASSSIDRVGWVSSSGGRSTSDILWNCFSIFLVCTWSCLHYNVPSNKESEAKWHSWRGVPYWPSTLLWRIWARKVCCMMLIIIAPEIGVATAMEQYLHARDWQAENHKRAVTLALKVVGKELEAVPDQEERCKITLTHAFFANMGGFSLRLRLRPSPHFSQNYKKEGAISEIKEVKIGHVGLGINQRGATSQDEIIFNLKNWISLGQYSIIVRILCYEIGFSCLESQACSHYTSRLLAIVIVANC